MNDALLASSLLWNAPWIWGITGALMGSFLNVVALRLASGQDYVRQRSACPHCGHQLGPLELIPLLSWTWQAGRCRSCRTKISARYPLTELSGAATLALGAVFAQHHQLGPIAFAGLQIILTGALACALIDRETQMIPDELSIPGSALALGVAAAIGAPIAGSVFGGLSPADAALGCLVGMGLVGAADVLGSWYMRRLRERRWPESPIGYQQISLGLAIGSAAGLAGAGPWICAQLGLIAAALSAAVTLSHGQLVRVPERWTLGAALISAGIGGALLASGQTAPLMQSAYGGAVGAGAAGWAAALWWAGHEVHVKLKARRARVPVPVLAADALAPGTVTGTGADEVEKSGDQARATAHAGARANVTPAAQDELKGEVEEDPVTMGFGDAKMLAALGALMGPLGAVMTLGLACMGGAIWGAVMLALRGQRTVRFGPWLLIGALISLMLGGKWIFGE